MMIINYLIFPIIMAVVSAIVFFVISKKNKVLSSKKVIFTFIGVGLLLSLFGAIAYFPKVSQSITYFFLMQLLFLGLGFLVSYFWNKNSGDMIPNSKGKWIGVFFIIVNMLIGMIGFALIFHYFNDSGLAPFYAMCLIPFILPQLINTVYQSYLAIPNDIYKVWHYPVYSDDVNTDEIDPDKAYMLEFEYTTSPDSAYTNTKIKAPIEMRFGDWFQAYIDYHNNKFDNNQIQFTNEDGTPQAWMFYERPSFFGTARYIDPDVTIVDNKISEKKVIIAKRVITEENIIE
jgi:Type VI secretion system, TssN